MGSYILKIRKGLLTETPICWQNFIHFLIDKHGQDDEYFHPGEMNPHSKLEEELKKFNAYFKSGYEFSYVIFYSEEDFVIFNLSF